MVRKGCIQHRQRRTHFGIRRKLLQTVEDLRKRGKRDQLVDDARAISKVCAKLRGVEQQGTRFSRFSVLHEDARLTDRKRRQVSYRNHRWDIDADTFLPLHWVRTLRFPRSRPEKRERLFVRGQNCSRLDATSGPPLRASGGRRRRRRP